MNFSSCSNAFPESMISAAKATPSLNDSTLPATYNPAAEFSKTAFLFGPFSPFNIDNVIFAFSFASQPIKSSFDANSMPKRSGEIS